MPVSKRAKLVSLTATKKKGKERKTNLMEKIKESVDSYDRVFVFSYNNMRNNKLQEVKKEWKDSSFFFGKNKVICKALGRVPAEEYKDDIHHISERLDGERGLLFTNNSKAEVVKFFKAHSSPDFARTGAIATDTVTLDAGPMKEFSFAMEPLLRELGLTTSLKKGLIILEKDHTVCEEGKPLSSDQARLLKLLGFELAEFRLNIECMWCKDDGFVEIVSRDTKSKDKKKQKTRQPLVKTTASKKARKPRKEAPMEVEEDDDEEQEPDQEDVDSEAELESN